MSFDHGFEVRVLYLLKSVWQSLAQGYYLDFAIFLLNSTLQEVQIVKIKPLFKKGSKIDPQNYCPISLLPLLSKIIERMFHEQTEEFLSKNEILYMFQSGFRKYYSTNTCLVHLTDKITTRFEKSLFTGMNDFNSFTKCVWHSKLL